MPNEREIAALLPMSRLLVVLGFQVNERARRCACILHGGANPSAFAWSDDGRWHCFSCGNGGDRIELVRSVRQCGFREALAFLATLAGVELEQGNFSRADIERLRQERQAEERAAYLLAETEHILLLELGEELESLRKLRHKADASLKAWRMPELCWSTLKFIAATLPRVDAAYCISAFAPTGERARFALHPELRPAMIDSVLEHGFVVDAKGYRFEVALQ